MQILAPGDEQVGAGSERRPYRDSVGSSTLRSVLGHVVRVGCVRLVAFGGANMVAEEPRVHDVLPVGPHHRIGECMFVRGRDDEPPGHQGAGWADMPRRVIGRPNVGVAKKRDELVR